jgi:hypothetical protein
MSHDFLLVCLILLSAFDVAPLPGVRAPYPHALLLVSASSLMHQSPPRATARHRLLLTIAKRVSEFQSRSEGSPPPQWHALIEPHISDKHTINFGIESINPIEPRNLFVDIAARLRKTVEHVTTDHVASEAFQILFNLYAEMETSAALRIHKFPLNVDREVKLSHKLGNSLSQVLIDRVSGRMNVESDLCLCRFPLKERDEDRDGGSKATYECPHP